MDIWIIHRKDAKSAKFFLCCGPGCNQTRCTRSAARMFTEHSRKLRLTLCVFAVNNHLILPARIEQLLYLIISEAAILQEARLTGTFRITLRYFAAEFLALTTPDVFEPFLSRDNEPVCDGLRRHPFFL